MLRNHNCQQEVYSRWIYQMENCRSILIKRCFDLLGEIIRKPIQLYAVGWVYMYIIMFALHLLRMSAQSRHERLQCVNRMLPLILGLKYNI